jgi:hypothetical protein
VGAKVGVVIGEGDDGGRPIKAAVAMPATISITNATTAVLVAPDLPILGICINFLPELSSLIKGFPKYSSMREIN